MVNEAGGQIWLGVVIQAVQGEKTTAQNQRIEGGLWAVSLPREELASANRARIAFAFCNSIFILPRQHDLNCSASVLG